MCSLAAIYAGLKTNKRCSTKRPCLSVGILLIGFKSSIWGSVDLNCSLNGRFFSPMLKRNFLPHPGRADKLLIRASEIAFTFSFMLQHSFRLLLYLYTYHSVVVQDCPSSVTLKTYLSS